MRAFFSHVIPRAKCALSCVKKMRKVKYADPACPCGDARHRMCRFVDHETHEVHVAQAAVKTTTRRRRFNWTARAQSIPRGRVKANLRLGNHTGRVRWCHVCEHKALRSQARRADAHADPGDFAVNANREPQRRRLMGPGRLSRVLACKYQRTQGIARVSADARA